MLFVRARTDAFLHMLSRATRQNETMLPFVFDDDDDGHTWPGDPDILWASVFFVFFFAFRFFFFVMSCFVIMLVVIFVFMFTVLRI